MPNTPTIHNSAKYGDIAKIVLMPGDPLRAKFIADNYLKDVVCFNGLRGMLGFTGTYKGKKVSVMGSGMGMPSIGIYSYELFKFYDVERIIRIGSCGAYSNDLELLDTIIVDNAYTESTFAYTFSGCQDKVLQGSKKLSDLMVTCADRLNIKVTRGTIITSDGFDYYIDLKALLDRIPKELNCIAADMECFGLFHVANILNKEAACILSVSDSHAKNKLVSSKDREKSLKNMIEIALESILE